jgi:multisubunit Na+/H+ antiporter MnhB subunit
MTGLTAGLIVALVGAMAFIVAAIVTARARIGRRPAVATPDSSKPSYVPIDLPEQARHFRVFGWMLVLLLYLVAIFCLLQSVGDLRIFFHWEQWAAAFGSQLDARTEIALYSRFWAAMGIVLLLIALWTQWRLRRRAM